MVVVDCAPSTGVSLCAEEPSVTGTKFVHDHVCGVYDHADGFVARAAAFLAEGLDMGNQVCYIRAHDTDESADVLGILRDAGFTEALDSGAARVDSLGTSYPTASGQGPAAQVQVYAAATQAALRQGYTGLRVAAEVTDLVSTPSRLDAFARYEILIDRYIAHGPFSAMCGYDRRRLDDHAISQLACLHPIGGDDAAPFRWHAGRRADVRLSGEPDSACRELFVRVLDRTTIELGKQQLIIDATGLKFVDHRAMGALEDFAAARRVHVLMYTRLRTAARIRELLDLKYVAVEVAQ